MDGLSSPKYFFYELMQKSQKYSRLSIDKNVEVYIVDMLFSLANSNILLQEPLFDLYNKAINTNNANHFKTLGDTSLLSLGVFKPKSGLSEKYYRQMGIIGYNSASELSYKASRDSSGYVYECIANDFHNVEYVLRYARGLAPLNVI